MESRSRCWHTRISSFDISVARSSSFTIDSTFHGFTASAPFRNSCALVNSLTITMPPCFFRAIRNSCGCKFRPCASAVFR